MRRIPALFRLGAAPALFFLTCFAAWAQQPAEPEEPQEEAAAVSESIAVEPVAADAAISERLSRILEATDWFEAVEVRVDEGLVFLEGTTDTEERKRWAGELARNTEGAVAVVNRIAVRQGSMWDLSPAWEQVKDVGASTVRRSPLIALALILLALTWWASTRATTTFRSLLARRTESQLLRNVLARAMAVPVFLIGLYVVLKVSGLTSLAITVLGGTGLFGLIVGFAFRDIAENFLASLLISVQSPFATGDLIAVAGYKGFVQRVNARSTLLMTLEGNHVQIPNATIYKETIQNFSANPYTRFDFTVGIGNEESIEEAQSVARSVLADQTGLAAEHEPWVIVDSLGAATVNLKAYFWVDTSRFNGLKVRSAVIRAVKAAFEDAGVSMPDEAREVVFPAGVPVRMVESPGPDEGEPAPAARPPEPAETEEPEAAEGDLTTEAVEIAQQARRARTPEGGENLIS